MHARQAKRNIPVVTVICLYLARSEKDLGQTKLVIFVIHTKRVKQRLQKKNRGIVITVLKSSEIAKEQKATTTGNSLMTLQNILGSSRASRGGK